MVMDHILSHDFLERFLTREQVQRYYCILSDYDIPGTPSSLKQAFEALNTYYKHDHQRSILELKIYETMSNEHSIGERIFEDRRLLKKLCAFLEKGNYQKENIFSSYSSVGIAEQEVSEEDKKMVKSSKKNIEPLLRKLALKDNNYLERDPKNERRGRPNGYFNSDPLVVQKLERENKIKFINKNSAIKIVNQLRNKIQNEITNRNSSSPNQTSSRL